MEYTKLRGSDAQGLKHRQTAGAVRHDSRQFKRNSIPFYGSGTVGKFWGSSGKNIKELFLRVS